MTARIVSLLLALTCVSVQATPVRPLPTGPGAGTVSPVRSSPVGPAPVGVPVNPYASTDPRLNAVRPVLELLVTLRQVQDAARGWPVGGPERRALAAVLARPAGEALDVQAAGVLHAQVLAALGEDDRARFEAGRATQVERLRALMMRARFASEDGQPQTARFAYSQWLGSRTVDTLLNAPDAASVSRAVGSAVQRARQAIGTP
ncbi:hypothetical protein [Deinococcus aquiradiocola]|uniref:Uncharacterized protein n=1 Tax=Deinococcus aquiradiocola TaxID=393059 RepID=A0A917PJW7_9DEIO|nr:hypothetical protein [Deinococcus aquiradiocola]GGJ81334.1 hypothetical protein GCM10008939_26670 [Deinococcus aquiradiocola]